jgi:hypothetical protein
LFKLATDLLSGNPRQAQVEHHGSRLPNAEQFYRCAPVGSYLNGVTFCFKQPLQGLLYGTVIFDYQNTVCRSCPHPLWKFLQTSLRYR